MGKPSTAAAPNFTAAAQQTANSDKFNTVTPYGSSLWNIPASGTATNVQTLSPPQQQILNQKQGLQTTALGNSAPLLSNPTINQSQLAAAPVNAGMTGQNAIMARLQPQIQQQRDQLHTQLVNWGLQPGSQAYDQAFKQQGQRENDLLNQAAYTGIGLDQQARAQGINEQQQFINTPINAINATASGGQIPNAGLGAGTNYLGAAQQQYAAANQGYANNTAGYNNLIGGLGSVASSLFQPSINTAANKFNNYLFT